MVIKSGNKDFIQPLDYLGLPFRCFRCHGLGHLANNCSLSFKKHSSAKVWRVKKDWHQSSAKAGIPVIDNLDMCLDVIQPYDKVGKSVDENLDVSIGCDPLANLKQINLSNPLDDNFFLNLTSEAPFSSIPNTSLKDLGFVSPCKAAVSKGYFLRSCTKSAQEFLRPVKDKIGTLDVEEGLTGVNLLGQVVLRGDGTLRASVLNQVPL